MNDLLENLLENPLVRRSVKTVKKGYFFLEDGYYTVLDRVSEYTPIYKIIDPIDNVFPSFILIIVLLLSLLAVFTFIFSQGPLTSSLRVVTETGSPIEGVSIFVSFQDTTFDLETDDWGETNLLIPWRETEAEITFSKEGFDGLTKTITLKADELSEFVLSKTTIQFKESKYTIYVVDSETNRLIKNRVQLSFTCSTGVPGPATITKANSEFKDIVPGANCGTLITKASAEGFQTKESTAITRTPTYIKLEKTQTTSAINVLVKDHTGKGIGNVAVKLFDSDNAIANQITTSASGAASFNEVQPGTYTVTASHSDGRYIEKTGIIATVGQTKTVALSLQELLVGKKIFLKFTDSESKQAVGDATVLIYANNKLLDSKTSDNSGRIEKMVDESIDSFLVVVTHYNYVTKIVSNVIILDAAATEPQNVQLQKASAQNSGKIVATVSDYETGESVENAYVYLHHSDFPKVILNYPYNFSNADGNVLFERLPAGNYSAKAKQDNAEGKSEPKDLILGSTISLPIVLVLTEGDIEVKVINKMSKEPISGVELIFFDSFTDSIFQSGTSDEEGEFESMPFKSNKIIYVKASKEGYLNSLSLPIPIIAKSTQKLELELTSKGDIDVTKDISIDFAGLFSDQAATKKENKLESGQSYYLKLNLRLPKDANYSALNHHLRLGPETVAGQPDTLPFQDYIARLTGHAFSSPQSTTVFSSCYNKASIFSNPCPASFASKQSNTLWQKVLGQTVYSLVLKFETEPNLADETEIEFRYKAKAVVNGAEFETDEFLKSFKIGETICTPKVDCPPVVWRLWLQDPDGNTMLLNNFSEEDKQGLIINSDYALSYELHNTSGYDLESGLEFLAKIPPSTVSIAGQGESYTVFSNFLFAADTVSDNGSPVGFQTLQESDFLQMALRFNSGRGLNDEKTLFFAVEAAGDLELSVSPSSLIPNDATQIIKGTVKSPSGNPIEGASIKIYLPSPEPGQPRQLFEVLLSDEEGNFQSSENFGLSAGEKVVVTASAAGFRNTSVEVPVKWGSFFDPRYNCIEVPSGDGEILTFSNIAPGSTKSFEIVNGCLMPVEIKFNSKLELSPQILQIPAGGKATARFKADNPEGGEEVYLGQYPIYLKAKFDGDVRFVNAIKVLVIIEDSTGSCFGIDKTSFDLVSESQDTGTISNNCAVQFNDAWAPELAINSFKAIINRTDLEIPGLTTFKWGVKAKMLLSKPITVQTQETASKVWENFYIPTGSNAGQTFNDTVTVNIGSQFVKNVDALQFDSVAHHMGGGFFDQDPDYSDSGYIKSNTITINSGGIGYPINVPCNQNGCDWGNVERRLYNGKQCHDLSPCWLGSFEVPLGQSFETIDSITVPIYNKENEMFLFFNLQGDSVSQGYDFDLNKSELEYDFGSFTSSIVPIRNLGFVLGRIDIDLSEEFQEQRNFIEDANLMVYTDNPEVEAWLVGTTVYGKYVGVDTNENPEETPFAITNLFLNTTQYNVILVDDYVSELRSG